MTRCCSCGTTAALLLPIGACSWPCYRRFLREARLKVLVYDLAAGRDVVDVRPAPLPAASETATDWCPTCWGQSVIWERGLHGLVPEPCPQCHGWGVV